MWVPYLACGLLLQAEVRLSQDVMSPYKHNMATTFSVVMLTNCTAHIEGAVSLLFPFVVMLLTVQPT